MAEETKTDVQAQLEALRAARAERERKAAEKQQALELEEELLIERLEQECGPRAERNYEIVSTPWGVFGLKKPDDRGIQAWNRMQQEYESKKITIDQLSERSRSVLRHYIMPAEKQAEFLRLGTERPGIVNRLGMAFMYLMGNEVADSSRKF